MANALLLIRPPGPALADTDVVTEPFDRSDLDGLTKAYWRSYAGAASGFLLDEAREDITRYFDGGYGRPVQEGSRLVRKGATVVGAVLTVREALHPDASPAPFVIDLFVVPQERRRRIGTALMVAALTGVGSETVGLRVEPDNAPARRLYEALGFKIAGQGPT